MGFTCILLPGGAQHPTFAPDPLPFAPVSSKVAIGDFSGGSVVENEPANAGITG